MKLIDCVDNIFSHNEIVALWEFLDNSHSLLWRGMAYLIPDKYKEFKFNRIFGTIPLHITEADTINIEIQEPIW